MLQIFNRGNTPATKKEGPPTLRISFSGHFVFSESLSKQIGITAENNLVDIVYDETEKMFYVSLTKEETGFRAHDKSGTVKMEKGAMFQCRTIKELIFEKSKLDQASTYNFLIPKKAVECADYPGRQFWPIITASAAKVISRHYPKK